VAVCAYREAGSTAASARRTPGGRRRPQSSGPLGYFPGRDRYAVANPGGPQAGLPAAKVSRAKWNLLYIFF
jgi:hypothetical protein